MTKGTWRDVLVEKILASPDRVTVVRDDHRLLKDDLLQKALEKVGVVCHCIDNVSIFHCMERAGDSERVFIVPESVFPILHTVEATAASIQLTPNDIFPTLDSNVIGGCSTETYDALFDYCRDLPKSGNRRTKKETEELVVRALFSLDLNRMTLESCVAYLFLTQYFHYQLPLDLTEYVTGLAKYQTEPGEAIFKSVPSAEELRVWLSHQWAAFTTDSADKPRFDFSNPDFVRILPIMFASGTLPVLDVQRRDQVQEYITKFRKSPWLLAGLNLSSFDQDSAKLALNTNLEIIRSLLPDVRQNPSPEKWLSIAQRWGQIRYLQHQTKTDIKVIDEVNSELGKPFTDFILHNYDRIIIGSTDSRPLTVDRILPSIANSMSHEDRIALLVFDGMGVDQWELVKRFLTSESLTLHTEHFLYASLPTLTMYSRRSILSGKTPNEFQEGGQQWSEERLFQQFWESKGLSRSEQILLHLVPDKELLRNPEGEAAGFLTSLGEKRAVGVIFSFIDDRMHGVYDLAVEKKLFQDGISEFLNLSCLGEILRQLKLHGFKVYVTSDHGNIVATGNGISDSKDLVEHRGKRCLVYDRELLASEKGKEADVSLFSSRFLPKDRWVVFPNGDFFFGTEGIMEITHGGISLEEMVVPFAEVG